MREKRNWLKELDAATTQAEVMEVVDAFIAERSDVYWSGVPEALRTPSIASEAELDRWHHELVKAISSMPSPGTPMQELCVFSLRASVRVHQIRLAQGRGDKPSNEGSFSAGKPRFSR